MIRRNGDLPPTWRVDEGDVEHDVHVPMPPRRRKVIYVQPVFVLAPLAWIWQRVTSLWLRLHGWP